MAGEWREMPFSHAVTVNPRVQLTRGSEYPFVDMQAVNAGSRCAYAGERRAFEGGGSRFAAGDTLMARITPCLENGKIARFCADQDSVAHGSTEFIVIRGRDGVTETDYAYYLTKWDGVSGYAISQMTGTSGRQRVPTESLDHLAVPVPPVAEQRAIAYILGTLDDKIDLNRRMNETLAGMARALFDSWFVDFDPVRAKAEGRDPGLPRHLADLFPDSFQESELGETPVDWQVSPLADCAEIVLGGTPSTSVSEYWNGAIPWAAAKDVTQTSGPFLMKTERTITQAALEHSNAKLLPQGTTVVTARGTVGSHRMLGLDMAVNQTSYALVPKPPCGKYYLYFSLGALIPELNQRSYGTVFDTITTRVLAQVGVVTPPSGVLRVFEAQATPFMDRLLSNLGEAQTLTALRDTMLLKLVSGEIRVRDAERIIGSDL